MVEMIGKSHITEKGLYLPNYPDLPDGLKTLKEFRTQEKDYLICSYPKSGTHWVMEVLSMLLSGSTEYKPSLPLPNLESGSYTTSTTHSMADNQSYRLLHSHLPLDHLPSSLLQQKIVYVLRDPRDQMVSLYHHIQAFKWSKHKTFEQFFYECMENPDKVEYGDWFRNVLQWWNTYKDNKNVLFLFYEGMKTDLLNEVCRLARFYDLSNLSNEFLQQVARRCTFVQMRNNKPVPEWFRHWHNESYSIYRKGDAGGWKAYFTPQMEMRFDKQVNQALALYSVSCPYTFPTICKSATEAKVLPEDSSVGKSAKSFVQTLSNKSLMASV